MKQVQYEIKATLWFDPEEDIYINEYLDKLRELGEAEVTDIKIVDKDFN